ncbi:MAG: flagellar hook-length control protein FliK [Sedimentisphaerales bacterium]|nr:flagellar hook-length control protein FliK [Sedimentisphaerales bacterium]
MIEGKASPAGPDKPPATKSSRAFAQMVLLVTARQPATADNAAIATALTSGLHAGAGPDLVKELSLKACSAMKPGKEALVRSGLAGEAGEEASCQPDVVAKRGSATRPHREASSKPDRVAKPGRSQEEGSTQSSEASMQALGCSPLICPTPSRLGTGRIDAPTGLETATDGGSSPQRRPSVLPVSGGTPSGTAGSMTQVGSPARQMGTGRMANDSTTAVAATEGVVSPDSRNAPSGRHVGGGKGKMAATVRPGAVTSGRGSGEPDKNPVAGKEHVVAPREDGATTLVQASSSARVQPVAATSDGLTSGIGLRPQPNLGRRDVGMSGPALGAQRNLPQSREDAHSQEPVRSAALGVGAPTRRLAGETSVPAGGKEGTLMQSGADSAMPLESVVLATEGSAAVSVGASDRADAAASLGEGPVPRGIAQSVGEQIQDSVRASLARGDQQVVIRLHPPELGSVVIRFERQSEQIDGVLEVSRTETRNEVERALPHVVQSLHELGLHIRKLEVTLSDPPQGDSLKQQLQQDAWAEQRNPGRSPSQAQHPTFESRISSPESAASLDTPAGRINLLV